MSSYAYQFKFLLIGDATVGKSSLMLKFIEGKFNQDYIYTIGIEYETKILQIGEYNINLQNFGCKPYKQIAQAYYRQSTCAIIVYDVTNRNSFDNIPKWLDEVKRLVRDRFTIALVGNKIDQQQKVVSRDEGEQLAKQHNLIFIEVSALTGEQVDKIFRDTAQIILNQIEANVLDPNVYSNVIHIGTQQTKFMIKQQQEQYIKQFSIPMSPYKYLFKFIIIGDSNVGKSCLIHRFQNSQYKSDYQPTIGVDCYGHKTLYIRQQPIKLQIWDTAGQESFKSITRSYYRASIGALVVYDTTNRNSFNSISGWIDEIRNYSNSKVTLMLVGNKLDLNDKRVISTKEGQRFALQHGLMFQEVSSKTGENVESNMADDVLTKIETNEIDPTLEAVGITVGTQLGSEMQQQQTKCC